MAGLLCLAPCRTLEYRGDWRLGIEDVQAEHGPHRGAARLPAPALRHLTTHVAHLLRNLAQSNRGVTLLEVIIAVGLFGIISVAFLAALSTGLVVGLHSQDKVAAASEATIQLESALAATYVEPAVYPTTTPISSRYSIATDNAVLESTLAESLAVTISSPDVQILDLASHKANLAYVAVPPSSTFTQQDYRWYANIAATLPTTPLAALNTTYTPALTDVTLRLRINIQAGGDDLAAGGQAFRLQYATSTSGPWTMVGPMGTETAPGGADNAGVEESSAITTLLASSNVAQTYEEANPSAHNPVAIISGQNAEWDWVIEFNAVADGTYYFRIVKSNELVLDTYTRYPTIVIATAP